MKICRENPYIGYNRTKISGRLWKVISKLYFWRRNKFATKTLLCNTEYFYIVDSDTQLNNAHRTHCDVSTATNIKRTRHTLTLYVKFTLEQATKAQRGGRVISLLFL